MRKHAQAVYAALTRNQTRFVRAEPLAYEAASLMPGLAPTRARSMRRARRCSATRTASRSIRESSSPTSWRVRTAGTHFCHAMLLPRAEALARACRIAGQRRGRSRHRGGRAARARPPIVFMRNPRYLNAEDEATLQQTETAVDLAHARSRDRTVRAARRHRRQSEICRQARVLDRHQSHASLSRQDHATCGT